MSKKPKASHPRAGRPTREQAEQRHDELLSHALDLFLEKGYELATIDAIASAVNMTKRTVYARYEDKAALFKAAVQRAIEQSMSRAVDMRTLETDNIEETLLEVARKRLAHLLTPEGLKLQRIINTESYRFPEIFTMNFRQSTGQLVAYLTELLANHAQELDIPEEDLPRAAVSFMALVISGPTRFVVSGNKLSAEELEAHVRFTVGLFLNGIRRR